MNKEQNWHNDRDKDQGNTCDIAFTYGYTNPLQVTTTYIVKR